jgi:hypothetical protein
MKTLKINVYISLFIYLLMAACHPKPKLYEDDLMEGSEAVGGLNKPSDISAMDDGSLDEHKVKVEEVLNTEKYSYLYVTEDGDKFWIAIPKKDVEIGATYYYTGGLLKRNFESKEYNRVFETIYLVSDVFPHSMSSGASSVHDALENAEHTHGSIDVVLVEGSIQLSELFSNRDKYQGKTVQVTGQCVKVNPMIMGRNWVHIQDGSEDGLDLTVTTAENVQMDDVVTFEGIIALNKDFGAGYKYDIIMEKATLK